MKDVNTEAPQEVVESKNLWPIIIAIVITAIVFGGLTYAWQSNRINKIESNANDKISTLEQKLTVLQTKLDNATKLTNTNKNETTKDSAVNTGNKKLTYSNNNYSFEYLDEYIIEEPKDYFPVLSVKKAENKMLEIFIEADFDEDGRIGEAHGMTQEEADAIIPKEFLEKGKFSVWLYYSEKDITTKNELHKIFDSIQVK